MANKNKQSTEVIFYNSELVEFTKSNLPGLANINSQSGNEMVDVRFNQAFDYKRFPNKKWNIFIDIDLSAINHFDIYVRCYFEVVCDIKNLFLPSSIEPLMKAAIDRTGERIEEECKKANLPFTRTLIPSDQDYPKYFATDFVEIFNSHRLKRETEDGETKLKEGLYIPVDNTSKLILNGTIQIIHKVLFQCPLFNRKHNREVFSKAVPIASYLTLRDNCTEINNDENEKVFLNIYSSTYVIICIDFALQLLLGDNSKTLEDEMEREGMTKEIREHFIKRSIEVLQVLKKDFSNIDNVGVKYDWNSLIK